MRLAFFGSILLAAGCGKTLPQSLEAPLGGFGRDAASGAPPEVGVEPRDLGGRLDLASPDAGRDDAGFDAGPEDLAPPDLGTPVCDLGAVEIELSSDRNSSYSGRARVVALAPLQFRVGREIFSVILGPQHPSPSGGGGGRELRDLPQRAP